MAEFPALPLWTDAFLGDTTHLTAEETGAYLMLLIIMWRTTDCEIPDDDRKLARWARCTPKQWTRLKPSIFDFLTPTSTGWTQKRLKDERRYVEDKRNKAAENGRASALKRKGRHSTERVTSVIASDIASDQLNGDSHTHTHTHTQLSDANESDSPISPVDLKTSKKAQKPKLDQVSSPPDVSESTWSDFLALRKAKNAPISETALSGIRREAEKAGWSMQNALAECCERGWQGFKAEWVKKGNVNSFPATGNDPLVDIILARKAREDAKKALNPPPNSPPSAIPSQGERR